VGTASPAGRRVRRRGRRFARPRVEVPADTDTKWPDSALLSPVPVPGANTPRMAIDVLSSPRFAVKQSLLWRMEG
jgi:hypothetical protein